MNTEASGSVITTGVETLYLFWRNSSIFIQFISSPDRLSRETCGTVPSAWLGCAGRASLQTQRHQAVHEADVLYSCPAPTSSTSHVWKPLKPFVSRADLPVPCADLCTIKNFSKEVRWLTRSKKHLLWNQTARIPESQCECLLASSVAFHNSKLFCHCVVVHVN